MKFGLQGWPFEQPSGGGAAYTFEPSLAFFAVNTYIACAGPGRFALVPSKPVLLVHQPETRGKAELELR
jgi:hypothetical protein